MDENPAHYARFGGAQVTHLNAVVLVCVLVAALLIVLLPRKHLLAPFLASVFIIPLGQSLVIGGANFLMFRLLIIAGLYRVFLGSVLDPSATRKIRLNAIDMVFFCFCISSVITFTILFDQSQAFINRMGFALDSLGTYFMVRFTLRDEGDVDRIIKVLAIVCGVVAACMVNEQMTGRNLFYIFGGVPQFTDIRDGALRSQGPFAHPILAGMFGAIMLPLFVRLRWRGKGRTLSYVGILSALSIIATAKSSTPLLAGLAGLAALGIWTFRKWMRPLRWGIVLGLIFLQIIMKAPVWALIGRVGVIVGSSGYHRYILVDNFIRRFSEWWLVGVRDTAHWGYDMWDVSNQYVAIGVSGGLITLILFIWVIVYCFKGLGITRKEAEASGDIARARGLWALGAALFANLVGFFGTTYFDQIQLAWYVILAIIASVTFVSHTASVLANDETIAVTWLPRSSGDRTQYLVENASSRIFGPTGSRSISVDGQTNTLRKGPEYLSRAAGRPLSRKVKKHFEKR